jgi:hypothetical protein
MVADAPDERWTNACKVRRPRANERTGWSHLAQELTDGRLG